MYLSIFTCLVCPSGSLASSDLFYDAFQHKGLSREALCPCAGSPETLTVSVRRWVRNDMILTRND